jgi:hypothetical protein
MGYGVGKVGPLVGCKIEIGRWWRLDSQLVGEVGTCGLARRDLVAGGGVWTGCGRGVLGVLGVWCTVY